MDVACEGECCLGYGDLSGFESEGDDDDEGDDVGLLEKGRWKVSVLLSKEGHLQ